MTFGFYETTLNGSPTGQYEAVVIGNDLTLDEFKLAEEVFVRYGGICKNHEAPDPSVKTNLVKGDKSKVKYKETVKGNDGISVYEVYTGAGVSIGVPGALAGVALLGVVLYLIGSGINDRREAAWFREHLANEPNGPDKLPVIDG